MQSVASVPAKVAVDQPRQTANWPSMAFADGLTEIRKVINSSDVCVSKYLPYKL